MKKKLLISFLLSLMLVPTVSSTAVMADDEQLSENITETNNSILVDDNQISETEINDQENIEVDNSNKDITLYEFIENTSKELDYFLSDESELTDSEKAQANDIKEALNDDTSSDEVDDSNISLTSETNTFTWSVPSSIDLGANIEAGTIALANNGDLTVSDYSISSGQQIVVTVKGSGTDGAFTLSNGNKTLDYSIVGGYYNTGGDYNENGSFINGVCLTVHCYETGSKSTAIYPMLTIEEDTNEKAGNYTGTLTFTAKIADDYTGYYADVDGDGTVDGVIFADLLGDSGKEKQYYISKESYTDSFGTAPVVSPVSGTTGNNRFYVIALSDVDSSRHYWYYSATRTAFEEEVDSSAPISFYFNSSSSYAKGLTKGYLIRLTQRNWTGKQSTAKMIAAWNSSKYGEQNSNDIWSLIQDEVANGWFIPSFGELYYGYGNMCAYNTNISCNGFGYTPSTLYWEVDEANGSVTNPYPPYITIFNGLIIINSSFQSTNSFRLATAF